MILALFRGVAFPLLTFLRLVPGFLAGDRRWAAAGAWAVPSAAGFIAGSQLAPVVVGRLGAAATMASALAIAAVGLAVLAGLPGTGGRAVGSWSQVRPCSRSASPRW
jgi:DHA2 family multidrug resistance protein-like MFS transporter